ncbi:hypothetical protein [Leifsonia sp. 1010]|uniref:hypothetical protein n=1 Tax=Leifsonia sp. 1010 TaxID=2817769 RepID=UPI00285A36B6|nr:hypothetical protein [Leifsonia sp. 1010]MDR6614091.1 hypothetical protein [Leifsonia sp. 1010]
MTAESTAEPLEQGTGSGRTTEVRLRQSSRGACVAAITTLIDFLLACLAGLFHPSPDQSALDRSLAPLIWAAVCLLAVAVVRSLFVGVYLSERRIRVRSWFRTYTIPIDAETRCRTDRWSSWFVTRGTPYRSVQVLFLSWMREGRRTSRSFPATAVRRSRAIAQADVINAFIGATTAGAAPAVRDFARGSEWLRITADSRRRLAERDAERDRRGAHA